MQHSLHARCRRTEENILIFTQHQPVVTLGYRRLADQLQLSVAELQKKGIAVIEIERGGGATYHGPGQLVMYAIFSSLLHRHGVREFVWCLEEVMCRMSQFLGVAATRRHGLPGAWVGKRKLGAVGIAVRRGVSLHGCAVNIDLDLQPFSYIIPCGVKDAEVTSLQQERSTPIAVSEVEDCARREFAAVFNTVIEEMPHEWCGVK
jgi:lipoate-protein ligase B